MFSRYEKFKDVFVVLFVLLVIAQIVLLMFTWSKLNNNNSIESPSALQAEITIKKFVELDSKVNSVQGLKFVDDIEKLTTKECFDEFFRYSERLAGLQETNDVVFTGVQHVACQYIPELKVFKCIAVTSEKNSTRSYYFTYIIRLDENYKVIDIMKLAHIK